MKKYGIISGSFDPITLGHVWLIEKALSMMDEVVVVIAHNSSKKYLFREDERYKLVNDTIEEMFTDKSIKKRIRVRKLPESEMLVEYAHEIQAEFIFRGIRNFTDFEYKKQINVIQKKINQSVETVYLIPPREIIEISSSLIKSTLHLKNWEKIASSYVSNSVIEALHSKI